MTVDIDSMTPITEDLAVVHAGFTTRSLDEAIAAYQSLPTTVGKPDRVKAIKAINQATIAFLAANRQVNREIAANQIAEKSKSV